MAFVFKMVDGHKCDGCARKIKKCIEKLQGVENAKVEKTKDGNGYHEFTIIVKGSFDPQKIILGVEIMKRKRIELVHDDSNGKLNQVKPIECNGSESYSSCLGYTRHKKNVEYLENLKILASKNLGKVHKLNELTNECEALKDLLHSAWARKNELVKQKLDVLNHDNPNPTLQLRFWQRGASKKEDESELLYGKLESKKIKLEDFVDKYKRLQLKKHSRINPLV